MGRVSLKNDHMNPLALHSINSVLTTNLISDLFSVPGGPKTELSSGICCVMKFVETYQYWYMKMRIISLKCMQWRVSINFRSNLNWKLSFSQNSALLPEYNLPDHHILLSAKWMVNHHRWHGLAQPWFEHPHEHLLQLWHLDMKPRR